MKHNAIPLNNKKYILAWDINCDVCKRGDKHQPKELDRDEIPNMTQPTREWANEVVGKIMNWHYKVCEINFGVEMYIQDATEVAEIIDQAIEHTKVRASKAVGENEPVVCENKDDCAWCGRDMWCRDHENEIERNDVRDETRANINKI